VDTNVKVQHLRFNFCANVTIAVPPLKNFNTLCHLHILKSQSNLNLVMIPYVFSAGEKNAEEVDWVRLGEEKLTIVNL